MSEIVVRKAERSQKFLKIALCGASGSGKTFSALLIAKGLGGKILCLDTENKSADLYSDIVDFDKVDIEPPFTIIKYLEVMKYAEEHEYTTLIIDSLSHAWAGEGGLLEQKNTLDSKPGSNQWTNWLQPGKEQEKLKSAVVQTNINIIGCMRAKEEFILTENDRGKKVPVKMGMAPIQREGFGFEFDAQLMLDMKHGADSSIGKDRTRLFEGKYFVISEQTGKDLQEWRMKGKAVPVAKPHEPTLDETKLALIAECKVLQIPLDAATMKTYGIERQIEVMKTLIAAKEAVK